MQHKGSNLMVVGILFLVMAGQSVLSEESTVSGTNILCSIQNCSSLREIPIQTCTGEGDIYLYEGLQSQPIDTTVTVQRDELLIFVRFGASISASINGSNVLLQLVESINSPFNVRIYKVATSPGDVVEITGSSSKGARAVQAYLAQDSFEPIYDVGSLDIVIDDELTNELALLPGTYNYFVLDKYSLEEDGTDDSRLLSILIEGSNQVVSNTTYSKPFPVGTQGGVVDEYTINDSGIYNFSVSTQDSVYWLALECPELPLCGDGVVEEPELCDEGLLNGVVCSPPYGGSCMWCSDQCMPEVERGPFCGDGIWQPLFEECEGDEGVGPNQFCTQNCTLTNLTFCGDGVKQMPNGAGTGGPLNDGNESCDGLDGVGENQVCSSNCTLINLTYCGDGIKQMPNEVGTGGPLNDGNESCDGTDGVGPHEVCTANCTLLPLTYCGDGIKQTPNDEGVGGPLNDGNESCDGEDGTPEGFSCTQNCTLREDPKCEEIRFLGPLYQENTTIWVDSVSRVECVNASNGTFYQSTLVEDAFCVSEQACALWNASQLNDSDWEPYMGPVQTGEESCHVFEFLPGNGVDVGEVIWACAFVDKTGPKINKTVGEPKSVMSQENIDFGEVFFPNIAQTCALPNGCWDITSLTPIHISCEDQQPHPSGAVELCFGVNLDGEDWTQSYCSMGNLSDGMCCLNQTEYNLMFNEESWHELTIVCKDRVNKSSDRDREYFKVEGTPFKIVLFKKWNLISVPFVLSDPSPEAVFGDILESVDSIWAYDPDDPVADPNGWLVWSPDAPGNLNAIKPGWGYWVLMKEDAMLTIAGSLLRPASLPPSRSLRPGWNLIGYYGTQWQAYPDEDEQSLLCGEEMGPKAEVFGSPVHCALGSLVDTQEGLGGGPLSSHTPIVVTTQHCGVRSIVVEKVHSPNCSQEEGTGWSLTERISMLLQQLVFSKRTGVVPYEGTVG